VHQLDLSRLSTWERKQRRSLLCCQRDETYPTSIPSARCRAQDLTLELTRGIIPRLIHTFPPHTHTPLAESKDEHPSPQHHDQPVPPHCQPLDFLSELELGDRTPLLVIPEEHFVRRVQG
jgi:hypothetical protein